MKLAVLAFVFVLLAVVSGQSWRILEKFSSRIPGIEPERFETPAPASEPSLTAVQAVLRAEGLDLKDSQFQVHRISETHRRWKWEGPGGLRVYAALKNAGGGWSVRREK